MSQHNIIGSEAFNGTRYIIVRNVRTGIGRRRRRTGIVMLSVAILALLLGALVAVFALAPLLMDNAAAREVPAATTDAGQQSPLRLQPVEAGGAAAATTTTN
ncbi:hypothetical protein [Brevundimonas sp.]|uniref:hypothetical protein n=1 Tax=Brevundimonas sp. TaxID=1871086 RepID=UPI002FCC0EA0